MYVFVFLWAIALTEHACLLILTVLHSLKVNFDEALSRDDVKAIVVTGKVIKSVLHYTEKGF